MPVERSKKYRERLELALLIEAHGVTMPQCSFCEKNERKCVVSTENSSRCNECVRRGQKCDVSGPSLSDLSSLLREQERLDREEEETTTKLLRLQKHKKFLRKRAGEMLRRGLKTMDELDEAEEKERKDKEEAERRELEARAAASTTFDLTDDQIVDLGLSSFDPSWATLDFADGNPSTASGS